MRRVFSYVIAGVLGIALVVVGGPRAVASGPVIADGHTDHLEITEISGGLSSSEIGGITQMSWGPDGRLYTATQSDGIFRYDYDPSTGLSNPLQVSTVNALGIGFHGDVMYVSPFDGGYRNDAGVAMLRDTTSDGIYNDRIDIVNNIRIGDHHIDQIQIHDNKLYVGIGMVTDDGTPREQGGEMWHENSYTGNITWIQDLASVENAALADPGNATNIAGFDGISGTDWETDATPFTSTDEQKLIVHSTGSRNPYGLAFDGDGQLWMTNNERDWLFEERSIGNTYQDTLYRAEEFGHYGLPNPTWENESEPQAAGFFLNDVDPITAWDPDADYDPENPTPDDPPGGLGPASSANGFDFYMGNDLPLQYHKNAFITRWTWYNRQFQADGETLSYGDIVAVNIHTGEVQRIAIDFGKGPLDVLADEYGNILVGIHGGGQGVYRISPTQTFTDAHEFTWDAGESGVWSDRLAWNHGLDEKDRLAPHEWGLARYAVTIDTGDPSHTVTLDQDARIDSLELAARLVIEDDHMLTVANGVNVQSDGELGGNGTIVGSVANSGLVSPGNSTGTLHVTGDYSQSADGTLLLQIAGVGDHDQLIVDGLASFAGTLAIELLGGYQPTLGDEFTLLSLGDHDESEFTTLDLPTLEGGLSWDSAALYSDGMMAVVPEPGSAALAAAGMFLLLGRRPRRRDG